MLFRSLQAVSKECGLEAAAAMVDLSLQQCCLYPGEMMQAVLCLEIGDNAKQIVHKIHTGEIDCTDIFSPISRREAEGRRSVRERLKSQAKGGKRRKDGER